MNNWNWNIMSMTIDNLSYLWNLYWLSQNKDITLNDIDTLSLPNSSGYWDWYHLSGIISINEIRANPDREWDLDGLSWNKDITIHDIDTLSLLVVILYYREI